MLVDWYAVGQFVSVAGERDVARLSGLDFYVVGALNDQDVSAPDGQFQSLNIVWSRGAGVHSFYDFIDVVPDPLAKLPLPWWPMISPSPRSTFSAILTTWRDEVNHKTTPCKEGYSRHTRKPCPPPARARRAARATPRGARTAQRRPGGSRRQISCGASLVHPARRVIRAANQARATIAAGT